MHAYNEEINKALNKDLSHVAEKDIDNMAISILNIKSGVELEVEKIKKLSNT
jgi:hypothetical protein